MTTYRVVAGLAERGWFIERDCEAAIGPELLAGFTSKEAADAALIRVHARKASALG